MSLEDKYAKAETDRRKYVDAILNSDAMRKIIVAGPGTGKTFLFKELLRGTKKKALRDLPIKITTIPGAKGLSEDYVFIAHFDDRFFLDKEGKVTDQNICNLLVALTRARKKVYLISCQAGDPKFLTWISKSRIESVDFRGA
jgi:Cdc6-like AAA superfamily ATPase